VLGFSDIAWTLSQVTRGGGKKKFVWGLSQQQAFDELKKCLFSSPVISLPDLQHPFDIGTNSSDYDVGAVLMQHVHPVAYHSETLSDVVRKYPNYDKEMYSIVQACRQWRHYILGKETTSTLIIRHYSSCRPKENCRMIAIRSGQHTYNSYTSTSSTKQEVPTELLTTLADLQSRHSPRC
jgi:hypothetical protein